MKFLVLCLILIASFAQAKEYIQKYDVDIQVLDNSLIRVRENIQVRAEGYNIKRGIFRKIITRRRHPKLGMINYDIIVEEILRNGKSEPYHVKSSRSSKTIYIGKKSYYIPRGIHTFTIQYLVNKQIFRFDNYDELYWNAIGTQWNFPIHSSSITLRTPKHLVIEYSDGWNGKINEKKKDFEVFTNENISQFTLTNSLKAKEGLTVAIRFPKNGLSRINEFEFLKLKIFSNKYSRRSFKLLILILFYYIGVWYLFGKDPELRVGKKLLFEPPRGYSPGALRYIYNMGYDQEVFTANILSLAAKEYILIEQKSSKKPKLILNPKGDKTRLTKDEKIMADELFDEDNSLTIKRSNAKIIQTAISKLKKHLKKEVRQKYFKTNSYFLVFPILFVLYFLYQAKDTFQENLWIIVGVFFILSLIINVAINGRLFSKLGSSGKFKRVFPAIFLIIHNGFFYFGFYMSGLPLPLLVLMIIITLFSIVFGELMKVPTIKGNRLMARIQGYINYLSHSNPKKVSTLAKQSPYEHFGEHMAYAFALGSLDSWSKEFHDDIETSSKVNSLDHHHRHYNHHLFHHVDGIGTFCSSFNSAVASSSSSGSSSGGSSGGGGGGGGGGGW